MGGLRIRQRTTEGSNLGKFSHVVGADGTALRKPADRGGYKGVVEFLDVPDLNGGRSDTPAWSSDGKTVFDTAQVGRSVESFQVTLDGQSVQRTKSAERAPTALPEMIAAGVVAEAPDPLLRPARAVRRRTRTFLTRRKSRGENH